MKKTFTVCIVALLFCAAARAEMDNPEYKNWAQFKPGSWVQLKSVTEAAGNTTESEITYTLVSIDSNKAVVEMKAAMTVGGNKIVQPAQTRDIPATLPEGQEGERPEMEEGSETVEVGGKSISCKWYKMTQDVGGNQMNSTTWTSDTVPGGLVKMESTMEGAYSSKTSMMALAWEAK